MLKLSTATPGQIATKFWLHPLDPNMAATFDGRVWTRYIAHKRGGVIGEWRELTKYYSCKKYGQKKCGRPRNSSKRLTDITIPLAFARNIPGHKRESKYSLGRFTLECYIGRPLESWEVCRHGTGGPNDHSYLNVSPGDAVNNMIDDLENGKSYTNLTYMIEANNRIARIISNLTSTKPNETTQATG